MTKQNPEKENILKDITDEIIKRKEGHFGSEFSRLKSQSNFGYRPVERVPSEFQIPNNLYQNYN